MSEKKKITLSNIINIIGIKRWGVILFCGYMIVTSLLTGLAIISEPLLLFLVINQGGALGMALYIFNKELKR